MVDQGASHDMGVSEEILSRHIVKLGSVLQGGRGGGGQDCSHLLFECPFAYVISASEKIPRLDVTSDEAFWTLLRHGASKGEMDQGRTLAVLWEIWLHRNEQFFLWRAVLADEVIQQVDSFVSCWCRRMKRRGGGGCPL